MFSDSLSIIRAAMRRHDIIRREFAVEVFGKNAVKICVESLPKNAVEVCRLFPGVTVSGMRTPGEALATIHHLRELGVTDAIFLHVTYEPGENIACPVTVKIY